MPKVLFIVFVLFQGWTALADEATKKATVAIGGQWIIDEQDHCQVWKDSPQSKELMVWSGACEQDKAAGHGTLQWFRDGKKTSSYVGEMSSGRPHGKGTYVGSDGSSFEGGFLDGKRSGYGVFKLSTGDLYEGEFLDGDFSSGKVFKVFERGIRYLGNYVDGKPNERGMYFVVSPKATSAKLSGDEITPNFDESTVYEKSFNNSEIPRTSVVSASKPCSELRPQIPRKAVDKKITGRVYAEAYVKNGTVKAVRIVSGPRLFHFVTADALLQVTCPKITDEAILVQDFNYKFE